MQTLLAEPGTPRAAAWYEPWQRREHVSRFDYRVALDDRNLMRLYETLNDVRLFNERFTRAKPLTVCEVGCATGDFYRYLRLTFPRARYCGLDVSAAAIERARAKYPGVPFVACAPHTPLSVFIRDVFDSNRAHVVYAADVMHHQLDPLGCLTGLIEAASEAVIVRCRTRDHGATVYDPARSRQWHYGSWVPYLVLNLEELLEHIRRAASGAEVVVCRNRMVLGGRYGRELPPECSERRTGTAETAVGIFLTSEAPGRITIQDRVDNRPNTTWDYKLKRAVRRVTGILGGRMPSAHHVP